MPQTQSFWYHLETAESCANFANRLMTRYLPSAWPGLVDITIDRAREHYEQAHAQAIHPIDAKPLRTVRDKINRADRRQKKGA